jgi:hypothetical protein
VGYDSGFSQNLGSSGFDLQPDGVFVFLTPDPAHGRAGVTIDQPKPPTRATAQRTILSLLHLTSLEGRLMEEKPELITIELYRDALEADLAKTRLDSAGITSFLVGENAAMLYGTGLGGLQLQVSPEDEVDARNILNDPGPPDSEVESVS